MQNKHSTGMSANAQHDGRPAEYRWRPLFNATKFDWHPLVECHAVTLPRRKTRWNLQGWPKTLEPISAVSRPKFTILSGHVEDVLLFNSFFPVFNRCLNCKDTARQSWVMVLRCRISSGHSSLAGGHGRRCWDLKESHICLCRSVLMILPRDPVSNVPRC